MKWQLKQPAAGDMIRVKLGSIYHYGVFVSEEEVVQFGLAPSARPTLKDSDIEVCASDIDAFLCGGFLEVAEFDRAERKKNRRPKEAVAYARGRLGQRGYNILYNNCEHFAYECVTGKPYCSQTADVRALFQSLPVVDVYLARIPEEGELRSLGCAARERELAEIGNPKVRLEKYYVWRLLEYALERSFGLRADKLSFTKTEAGKWTTEKCAFSLSHCDGAVAVAVSRAPVGVDVESLRALAEDRFAAKILNAAERALYDEMPAAEQRDFILEKWTAKEALFKREGGRVFVPREQDTLAGGLCTKRVELDGDTYVLSVATDTPEVIRAYIGVKLK
ncbi:MAG: 4'-phosphopantetheinyl transferase superfamily protein [Ruminococcaceae bacterium]|nr:4'-phosphopantetheinyl transferase superfamily protein [Oscillospiraceae bacterium]